MIVPRNTVLQGHVLDKLKELPNDCADVICTSSPYWGLRDYGSQNVVVWDGKADCPHQWDQQIIEHQRGSIQGKTCRVGNQIKGVQKTEVNQGSFCQLCGAWRGQLGLEPHPQLFIYHLVEIFREAKRVLKPSGSCWIVLGDSYFGGNGKAGRPEGWQDLENDKLNAHAPEAFIKERNKLRSNWLQPKQKMLIPERFAIAMQEDGWILRNTVIWHKINHMPSTVRDRLTSAYESVFFFVKSERYYFDLDGIRRPHKELDDGKRTNIKNKWTNTGINSPLLRHEGVALNPMGANPGDVWSLTSEGFKGRQHFATFPQKLIRRILEASAPKQICNQCGKPRIRLTEKEYPYYNKGCQRKIMAAINPSSSSVFRTNTNGPLTQTIGWSDCGCNQGFHSALVLDPFCGSGTTLLVAHKMGLDWLGIDLNPEYCKIAETRIAEHGKIRLDGFLEQTAKTSLA